MTKIPEMEKYDFLGIVFLACFLASLSCLIFYTPAQPLPSDYRIVSNGEVYGVQHKKSFMWFDPEKSEVFSTKERADEYLQREYSRALGRWKNKYEKIEWKPMQEGR